MTVDIARSTTEILGDLREVLGDRLLLTEEDRRRYCSDFGRMVDHLPAAVALCRDTAEVAAVVRFCRERRIPVVPRGQAHTQSGQATSDGGVVVDTARLSSIEGIDEIDPAGPSVTCGAGVIWRDLVSAALEKGLVPRVLTNNLGVSISGTLSMAGLGVASFRYGTQADNALELEVVTGTGEVVVCSREAHRDLFDSVRCGLGQFGIITKAKMRLRACKPKVRKYYLLYDDLGVLMEDVQRVMHPDHPTFSSLESWCTPCLQGIKKIGEGMALGEGMQTFAAWFYPVHLTVELDADEDPDTAANLAGLRHYRHVHTEDFTQHEFLNRMDPVFELWRRSGYWDMPHPWMETILPWGTARDYIEQVLSITPPQALGPGGHILLWPAYNHTSDVPLFMRPLDGDFVMGWGILPAVPPAFLDRALTQLDMASELSIHYGGKRYLSGYITFKTAEQWAAHYGDRWPQILAAKKKYDPDGILAPGFIVYE
ncbi:MAG TPA: FAD-binding protein [Thermoanaerobaculia bacterium]|nr:FAD-binding protein [Thermoanaerobaculia bacterium]